MLLEHIERSLPYSAEQLFDLAADIERYPQFLRWWIAVTVRSRETNHCLVDSVVGFGPARITFTSAASLQRPERIDVTSDETPFRHFRLTWIFEPQSSDSGGDCRVSLDTELELRSKILQRIVDVSLRSFLDDIILAFEARAFELYVTKPARASTHSNE